MSYIYRCSIHGGLSLCLLFNHGLSLLRILCIQTKWSFNRKHLLIRDRIMYFDHSDSHKGVLWREVSSEERWPLIGGFVKDRDHCIIQISYYLNGYFIILFFMIDFTKVLNIHQIWYRLVVRPLTRGHKHVKMSKFNFPCTHAKQKL